MALFACKVGGAEGTPTPYVKTWSSGNAATLNVNISDYTDYQNITVDKLHVYGSSFFGGSDGQSGYISCAPTISGYNSSTGTVSLAGLNSRDNGRNIYVQKGVVMVY